MKNIGNSTHFFKATSAILKILLTVSISQKFLRRWISRYEDLSFFKNLLKIGVAWKIVKKQLPFTNLHLFSYNWTVWHHKLKFNFRAVFDWVSKEISRFLWFCITTLCDWLTNLPPPSRPMGIQTKTSRVLAARVFPRLAPVTCICFEFWLIHCVVYICCDWPEYLLWFLM